jgi:tetratricopeptide (TPR) repeat protein
MQTDTSTRDQHAAYYLGFWRDREIRLKSADQRNALRELIADVDNFRSAWDWAVHRNHFKILYECLLSLLIVYDLYGWHPNAIKRLGSLIHALESGSEMQQSADIYGLAISLQGWFYFRRGQLHEARDHFEQGLAILRPFDNPQALADTLTLFSPVLTSLGEGDKALQYLEESLNAAHASGDSWRIAHALMMQGAIMAGWGQYDRAYTSSQEALRRFRALGDPRLTIVTLNTLGFVALQSSRFLEARKYLMESLTLMTTAEDPWSAGTAYGNLGIVELAQGNAAEAKALLQIAIPLFADLGMLGDVAYFMTHLGEAEHLLSAIDEAESHWLDAIRLARQTEALPAIAAILIRLARLYADRGDIVRAYEWAILIAGHPAAWQDSKARAEQLRKELQPQLTPDQIEAAQVQARSRTLDAVGYEIINRSGESIK